MEVIDPQQTQLGRYRIERALGAGGMGIVHLARDTKLRRQVAIKKLRKDATSASASIRIQREAQLLARLNHSNIVQLYDVLEEEDGIALVMEYVEGTTLKEWMREHSVSLRDKINLLMQICSGLEEAHSLGIIHRDLKPDNVLITSAGIATFSAKITDFGIAKSQQQDAEGITREDHVAGTVEAMSPEQLLGHPLDARSDLFSLGTLAYQLLCGTRPFEKGQGGSLALVNRVINDPHIPPQDACTGIPEPLAALLDRLLDKNPDQRPQSAQQVREALDFLHQHSADSDTQVFSETVTMLLRKPPTRRRRFTKILTSCAAAVLLTGAGYWGWKVLTRLKPQYIAIMPVEINGEVRGGENARALTTAMVRQALASAASQLKASALVTFEPEEGEEFESQLKALWGKGVTDSLFARLECIQVRCHLELQRLNPRNSRIKQQESFTFLADNQQESAYRITNSTAHLFDSKYRKNTISRPQMNDKDYKSYLNVVSKTDGADLSDSDLSLLEELVEKYPKNINLYRAYTHATTNLYVASNKPEYITSGLSMIEKAKLNRVDRNTILELELWLRTYDTDIEAFEALFQAASSSSFPPADILNKYSRFLYLQGEYQAGLDYAEKAAKLNPAAENFYLAAINQYASGNYKPAIRSLNESIALQPNHWASYETLAAIYGEMGDYRSAESLILKIPPKFLTWQTYSNLGSTYFVQRKYKKALEKYQKSLELAPNNLPTLGNISEIYLVLNEKQKYRESYQQILRITSGSTKILERTYHLLALAYLGKISESVSLAHQLNQDAPDDTYVKYASAQIYALAEEYRSANYFVEQLLDQGMDGDWFVLPIFSQLCTQPSTSQKVTSAICN